MAELCGMHYKVSAQPFIPFKPTLFLAVCWSVHNPEEPQVIHALIYAYSESFHCGSWKKFCPMLKGSKIYVYGPKLKIGANSERYGLN